MESCTDRMHRRASSNFDVASHGSQNFTVFVLGKVNGIISSFTLSVISSLSDITAQVHSRDNRQAATVGYSRTEQRFASLSEPLHMQDHPGS